MKFEVYCDESSSFIIAFFSRYRLKMIHFHLKGPSELTGLKLLCRIVMQSYDWGGTTRKRELQMIDEW